MIKDENFVNKQGWMLNKLGLKGRELEVYSIIYGFSQIENQMFTGSIDYLAEWEGCSRRTIERVLKKLVFKNYIIKVQTKNGLPNFYYANLKLLDTYDKMSHDLRQNVARTCDKMSHNNKYNNKPINISKKAQEYNSFPQNVYNFEELEKEFITNK